MRYNYFHKSIKKRSQLIVFYWYEPRSLTRKLKYIDLLARISFTMDNHLISFRFLLVLSGTISALFLAFRETLS